MKDKIFQFSSQLLAGYVSLTLVALTSNGMGALVNPESKLQNRVYRKL